MKKIDGKPRSLRELLSKKKYKVHYYQREYRWQRKQIEELLEDITSEFLYNYSDQDSRSEVAKYSHYFMGSVVLSKDDDETAIIDGQQRLTSFTLLLIYLHHAQVNFGDKVEINDLIFSEKYGTKSYNIDVESRTDCMDSLFKGIGENTQRHPDESVLNLLERYKDIVDLFPDSINEQSIPYFIDWLIECVDFIEITAETEQDAHKIFVSMNDRGLNLTPAEMLKGFLLSEISDNGSRQNAEKEWKRIIYDLKEYGKDEDADFLKTFLRAQYAKTIRERKKDAEKRDFDLIGSEFHKWVRDSRSHLNLKKSKDYEAFILKNMVKYAEIYIRILHYSKNIEPGFEFVYYNAKRDFTFQSQLILSSISLHDNDILVDKKIKIVSWFIDYLITLRVFNFKTLTYSSIRNNIFEITLKIRNQELNSIKTLFLEEIDSWEFSFEGIKEFYLNQYSRRYMLHILARITHFVEVSSDVSTSSFEKYILKKQKNPFDLEHILPDDYSKCKKEFSTELEFNTWRNKFGALLILPSDKNRSFKAKEYKQKVKMYYAENLLAQSLHPDCYISNPRFIRFKDDNKLEFKHLKKFTKIEITERQTLYESIAKLIWNTSFLSDI